MPTSSDLPLNPIKAATSTALNQSGATVACVGEVMLESVVTVAHLPGLDETVVSEAVLRRLGGGAWNIARHLADLGRRPRLGAVLGRWDLPMFECEMDMRQVDTSSVVWSEGSSDLLFYFKTLSAYSAVYQKAAMPLDMEIRLQPVSTGCDMLVFSGSRHARLRQFYIKTAASCTARWKVLAPNYAVYEYAEEELRALLPLVDVLILNEGEALYLQSRLDTLDLRRLLAKEDGVVVMTRGQQGALLYSADGLTVVPARSPLPGDHIGAGDAFAAGFLEALLAGMLPTEAARAGVDFAALVIGRAATPQGAA